MNKIEKIGIVVVLVISVAVVIAVKQKGDAESSADESLSTANSASEAKTSMSMQNKELEKSNVLPRLVDLGAGKCIPCKMMAPILDELKEEYKGRLKVEFIDVWENSDAGSEYGIKLIPTQIFYSASGKELFRHEGFYSKEDILAKWKEFGVNLVSSEVPAFEQLTPAQPDERPRDTVCYMCDRDINERTMMMVQTDKGPVRLCSAHCYFIMYSCLTQGKAGFEKKVSVTDWNTKQFVPATEAVFLYGQDETTGKPWIKAFADRQKAVGERAVSGGNILALAALQEKEMSHRCGFCERACYPQDAAKVIVADGVHTWGCCSHCALGVAARTAKDIEVHEKDRLTGQEIVVKTFDGKIASLEPKTSVAWFGQRKRPDGTWGSAGCFHQGFFVNVENLKRWIEKNPYETGRLIPISKALADKMKLSPEQIKKACKIGECAPK
jgi:thioredoxin 1